VTEAATADDPRVAPEPGLPPALAFIAEPDTFRRRFLLSLLLAPPRSRLPHRAR